MAWRVIASRHFRGAIQINNYAAAHRWQLPPWIPVGDIDPAEAYDMQKRGLVYVATRRRQAVVDGAVVITEILLMQHRVMA